MNLVRRQGMNKTLCQSKKRKENENKREVIKRREKRESKKKVYNAEKAATQITEKIENKRVDLKKKNTTIMLY